jgi:hypothetical protein
MEANRVISGRTKRIGGWKMRIVAWLMVPILPLCAGLIADSAYHNKDGYQCILSELGEPVIFLFARTPVSTDLCVKQAGGITMETT